MARNTPTRNTPTRSTTTRSTRTRSTTTRHNRLVRRSVGVLAAVGMAFLLSGCVVVPAPYYHPHYGYYGWR